LTRLGAILVPLNTRLTQQELSWQLCDVRATLLLSDTRYASIADELQQTLTGIICATLITDTTGAVSLAAVPLVETRDQLRSLIDLNATQVIMYTSGTTGHPKGAWRPNGVDIENVLQVISIFGLDRSDVHLWCGPGYHSGVAFFVALHQVLGATNVIQPKFEADGALDLIERHRATTTFIAPTLLQRLIDAQQRRPRDLSSLRAVILGAAPCPHALKVRAEAVLGQVLWEFYGATETGINTVLRPEDQLRKPGSCGTAVPGQEIKLVGTDGREVAVGEPGEFMVRNGWLAEYYHRPDATGKSMHNGFFSVGDVAYRDGEGYYYICDRQVDMIISGGVNIYPAEVEAALHAHPAVMDVAVFGVPDEQWGESVKAVVQLRPGMSATPDELIAFCDQRLAGYKKPRSIDFVDELPRDAAGKLLKRKIREPYWAGMTRRV